MSVISWNNECFSILYSYNTFPFKAVLKETMTKVKIHTNHENLSCINNFVLISLPITNKWTLITVPFFMYCIFIEYEN